jgi:hypothetical protein
MAIYETTLSMKVYIETDGNPEATMNELVTRFAMIETQSIGVNWDETQWDLQKVEDN